MNESTQLRTVLLVEDTEDNRFMMRRLLEMTGYRVIEARNGEEAVQTTERERPDLVLMDLSLPVIDGLEATRIFRSSPAWQQIPIVVISAHEKADFQAEALQAGCDAYVTKPIDFSELEVLIAELLHS